MGQPRVLRQHRTVQVSGVPPAITGAFGAVLPVVAGPAEHVPERLGSAAQVRAPAVILEPHDLMLGAGAQIPLQRHVPHEPGCAAFFYPAPHSHPPYPPPPPPL